MIRLRTFGSVALERDGTPLGGRNTQRRRLALLVILAAHRTPVSRDRVLALLWPERDEERGRHVLAQLLYELRRDLGQEVVTSAAEELSLDPRGICSDVADFERAMEQRDYARASALYTSPFLDGFFVSDAPEFERWADEQRIRIARDHLTAMEALAEDAERRGDLSALVELRRRIAAADPLSARSAISLMQALARAGDVAAAMRHAKVHAALLRAELDVDPDPAVAQLAARLASAPIPPTVEAPPPVREPQRASRRGSPYALIRRENIDWPESDVASRTPIQRGWRNIGILAAALLLAVAVAMARRSHSADAPRTIVLGEIQSPDTVLAMALREAVRAELERTPELSIASDDAVGKTLRLMELTPSQRLTEGVADDVALRQGTPLVVIGQAIPVGSGAQILLRLVDADGKRTVFSTSEWARTATDIVPATARVAERVRAEVGSAVVSEPGPLPAVTTTSVEALRDYALARAALARVDRETAIDYGEAALAQDSSFALAHYLLGDLLWYVDHERDAEAHLSKAYALSARLPVRERLLVRARYTQIVLDRPDSALAYWHELRAAYPREPLGYEGSVWADLAVGNYADAAAAADSALRLDSAAAPHVRNRMIGLLGVGDTAGALRLTRTAGARWPYLEQQALLAEYEERQDWPSFERVLDSIAPPLIHGAPNLDMAVARQTLLLSLGRVREAERYSDIIVGHMHAQFAIRSELWQARGELAWTQSGERAERLLHDAITRLDSTDLSAPANARLSELAAGVAAAARDTLALARLRAIVASRDAGRHLPSHELAQLTIAAADDVVRGRNEQALTLLERSRRGRFFGRSGVTLALLEGDALTQLGERACADSLYRVATTIGGVNDDGETWLALRPIAARALAGAEPTPHFDASALRSSATAASNLESRTAISSRGSAPTVYSTVCSPAPGRMLK